MLLDEFEYNPDGHEGGGLLSVLQGQFSFVSGEAAHTAEDALMIETPTMTIGVRGTKVVAHAGAEGETSRIALLAEEDGTVGKIMVTTDEGSQLIAEANMMVEVTSRFEAPSPQVQLSTDQVFDFFNSALSVLPAPAEFLNPEGPEAPDSQRGAESAPRVGESADSGAPQEAGQPAPETVTLAPDTGPQSAAETASEAAVSQTSSSGDAPQTPEAELPTGADSEGEAEAGESGLGALDRTSARPTGTLETDTEVSNAAPARQSSTAAEVAAPAQQNAAAAQAQQASAPAAPVDLAPVLDSALADQNTAEDNAFSLDTSTSFSDPGDSLTFSATLGNGSSLPGWLSIDANTGELSGTPANGDVGSIDVKVTATDVGGQSADSTFQLTVTNVNDAPTVSAISNSAANEDAFFVRDLSSSFADVDTIHGDSLTYSATLVGGAPLPGWMLINASTGEFRAVPSNTNVGSHDIEVTATDASGASVSTTFQLNVANVNDAPIVGTISDTAVNEDSGLNYDVSSSFNDVDFVHGDSHSFSATLVGGAPLPGWLTINSSTGVLSGTPGNGDVGAIDVEVTATDTGGATAKTSFTLTVNNVNDAPTVTPIANTAATEDSAFNYDVSGSFADVDSIHGDSLSFSAELVGGGSLPSWLTINASTGVLSGTPANGDVGSLDVKVIATDGSGESANTSFQINISNVNDAPVLSVSGSPTLTAIAEDSSAPAGNTVGRDRNRWLRDRCRRRCGGSHRRDRRRRRQRHLGVLDRRRLDLQRHRRGLRQRGPAARRGG